MAETVFDAPKAGRKYLLESVLWPAFAGVLAGFSGFFLFLRHEAAHVRQPLFPPDPFSQAFLSLLTWVPLILCPVVGVWGLVTTLRERALFGPTRGRELIVADDALSVSIGLFQGDERGRLRRAGSSYLRLPWSAIREFSVEPPRRSPPYYRITYSVPGSELQAFAERSHFAGREQSLVDAIAARLPSKPVLNDHFRG